MYKTHSYLLRRFSSRTQLLLKAFDHFDLNSDGALSSDEIEFFFRKRRARDSCIRSGKVLKFFKRGFGEHVADRVYHTFWEPVVLTTWDGVLREFLVPVASTASELATGGAEEVRGWVEAMWTGAELEARTKVRDFFTIEPSEIERVEITMEGERKSNSTEEETASTLWLQDFLSVDSELALQQFGNDFSATVSDFLTTSHDVLFGGLTSMTPELPSFRSFVEDNIGFDILSEEFFERIAQQEVARVLAIEKKQSSLAEKALRASEDSVSLDEVFDLPDDIEEIDAIVRTLQESGLEGGSVKNAEAANLSPESVIANLQDSEAEATERAKKEDSEALRMLEKKEKEVEKKRSEAEVEKRRERSWYGTVTAFEGFSDEDFVAEENASFSGGERIYKSEFYIGLAAESYVWEGLLWVTFWDKMIGSCILGALGITIGKFLL